MIDKRLLRYCNSFFSLLCVLLLLTACGSRRTIVHALDEKEANEILVFLANRGINATKEQAAEAGGGGAKVVLWNISVESTQAQEAMAILNQAGLPRRRGQNLLTIFKDVGLVPSELQEKIRFQAGLAEQIASTIRKIDGVLDADVQVSFPEEDPFTPGEKKQKITASVYVKHSGVLDDPNAHLVARIKRLVASSVPGLNYDDVTVIGDRARFSDIPLGLQTLRSDNEKNYVNIWSVVVAQESVTRFRIIFFSFTFAILLLLIVCAWIIWKFSPILKNQGFSELIKPHPISIEPKKMQKSEEEEEKEEEEENIEEEPEEEEKIGKKEKEERSGKNFDET